MKLEKFLENQIIKIFFEDGDVLIGKPLGYTPECDDDDGANLVLIPTEGFLKGDRVECFEHEVVNVEVIE